MLDTGHRLPLLSHPILQSSRPDETKTFLAAKSFDLRIGVASSGGRFRSSINAVYLPKLYLSTVTYGMDVEIEAGEERCDYAVQIPLAGSFEVRTRGATLPVGYGQAAIGMQCDMLIRSDADCIRLSVSIQRDALVAQLAALTGEPADRELVFVSAASLDNPNFAGTVGLLRWALGELDRNPSLFHNRVLATQFEQLLITALLFGQESNYRARLESLERQEIAVGSVRRAIDYIEAHAAEPLRLTDLVAVAGVAGRTLHKHFRLSKGLSPMAYLRRVRLCRAHEDLVRGDPANTVTEIAERWGFDHLGRFAMEYRRCYGETPSETLKRRRH
jgi:AraC-like DNA-binding protein